MTVYDFLRKSGCDPVGHPLLKYRTMAQAWRESPPNLLLWIASQGSVSPDVWRRFACLLAASERHDNSDPQFVEALLQAWRGIPSKPPKWRDRFEWLVTMACREDAQAGAIQAARVFCDWDSPNELTRWAANQLRGLAAPFEDCWAEALAKHLQCPASEVFCDQGNYQVLGKRYRITLQEVTS